MLPEERVRTLLMAHMIENMGYPKELIVVEKELAQLPHIDEFFGHALPKRRVDLLVYLKEESRVRPLLMIECKAIPLTARHRQQLISYNTYVRAPFLALVNERQQLFAAASDLHFQEGMLTYCDICSLYRAYLL